MRIGSNRLWPSRLALFDAVNLDPALGVAYELKEAFRTAMAIGRSGDVETFTAALELYDALCIGSGIEAFVKARSRISMPNRRRQY